MLDGRTIQQWDAVTGIVPDKKDRDIGTDVVSPLITLLTIWAAKLVAELSKGEDLKAGVILHPYNVTVDNIKGIKVPFAILGAEIDELSPPELIEQFRVILSGNPEVDSFVKVYPGVVHGWTLKYDENDEVAVRNAEEAHAKLLEWLNKYLN